MNNTVGLVAPQAMSQYDVSEPQYTVYTQNIIQYMIFKVNFGFENIYINPVAVIIMGCSVKPSPHV